MESLRVIGSEMMNCVDLCLILQVESNFVESIGQTPLLGGVPQGSCLGPLLFLFCINGLPIVVENRTVAMPADDTGLYLRGASLAQLNRTINKNLKSLYHWLKESKLSLNVVKTFSINFLSRLKYQKILSEIDLKYVTQILKM